LRQRARDPDKREGPATRKLLSHRVITLLDKVSFAPEHLLDIVDRALGVEPATRRAA